MFENNDSQVKLVTSSILFVTCVFRLSEPKFYTSNQMIKSKTKNIGRWLIIIFIMINLKPVMSQSTQMVVHKTDGTKIVFPIGNIQELTFGGVTGIDELQKLSNTCRLIELLKAYPNPVQAETKIEYQLNEPGQVRIQIFNQQGALVKELLNQIQPVGRHSIQWNAKGRSQARVKTGLYLCKIQFKNQNLSQRIIVID